MFQHTAARRRLGVCMTSIIVCSCFNTQPPEGGWSRLPTKSRCLCVFQHTAARRRLANPKTCISKTKLFQHTAARRRLGFLLGQAGKRENVSTHSRPKAAGWRLPKQKWGGQCFNTQPPEGGWPHDCRRDGRHCRFNTQPPEGGWKVRSYRPPG